MLHSISTQDAMEIVTQINSIMDRRVNIMNAEGVIVGSSDPKRIGTYHEGARMIVEQRLSELLIHYDGEYAGTKRERTFPSLWRMRSWAWWESPENMTKERNMARLSRP